MRTKEEFFDEIERATKEEKASPEYIGAVIGVYLEVLIDLRDLHAEILYALKTYILHERGKD